MPRYGPNLYNIVHNSAQLLSNVSIFHLGLQLLDVLQLIHDSGYVYNDLKFENIVIGINDQILDQSKCPMDNIFRNVDLNLIDFGLATNWLDLKTGKHVEKSLVEFF